MSFPTLSLVIETESNVNSEALVNVCFIGLVAGLEEIVPVISQCGDLSFLVHLFHV